jgi:hypothetical protein
MNQHILQFEKMAEGAGRKIEVWISRDCHIPEPISSDAENFGALIDECEISAKEPGVQDGKSDDEPEAPLQELGERIEESEVVRWFQKDPSTPNGVQPIAGLRLLTVKNRTRSRHTKFPMEEETLRCLLREWEFPSLDQLSNAIYLGGYAVFKAGSNYCPKISMT